LSLSDNGYATATGYLRERRELTLAGRLGTPIGDNALLYGKIGYANAQVRVENLAVSEKRDLDGVLFGAGAEVRITPRVYLKGEYRYTDYADGYVANNIVTGVGIRF
jgi:outer membrane immunogenic protein